MVYFGELKTGTACVAQKKLDFKKLAYASFFVLSLVGCIPLLVLLIR